MTVATAQAERDTSRQWLFSAAIIIVVGILATTLAQPQVLARLPLQNLLKNELHVGRTANAAFFFWAGLAWYFKPLFGIAIDAFPLFGSRRRNYMIVGAGAAGLAWLGVFFTPHLYGSLLGGVIIINIFMVIASTAVGGYMVEAAQASAASGRLTALREFVQQVCLMIRGPLAGFLASVAFGWTAGACGLVVLLLVPTAAFFLFEKRMTVRSDEILTAASTQFVRIVNARTMWAAAGLTALFYIAPGVNTAVFYIQQNVLHFNTQQQGMLLLYYGIAGVIAALIYSWACRRVNLRSLLIICLLAATTSNASYLFYTTPFNAQVINALDGFCYTLAELVMMDLAIRATPAGSESLGFSLMVSVRNFALFGTDLLGSYLMDTYHLPFSMLVVLNAAFTFVAVPLSLLLPRILVMKKDAEVHEDAAMPRSAMQD